jgi:hypothetical protein
VKNLAHEPALQLLDKTAPSKFGIKHPAEEEPDSLEVNKVLWR